MRNPLHKFKILYEKSDKKEEKCLPAPTWRGVLFSGEDVEMVGLGVTDAMGSE